MDLVTFHRLLEPSGEKLLALTTELLANAGPDATLAIGQRLRKDYDATLVAAAMTQVTLRRKARDKFGDDATRLYLTSDALEQATRSSVATYRADRAARTGVRSVVDLGCGVGADLIAFARAGCEVRGVERDPVRAAIAQANLTALRLPGSVTTGDAERAPLLPGEYAFCDPARRTGRGRTFDVADFEPSWEFVTERLRHGAIVKTMPGLDHALIAPSVEGEWISDRGRLVEACLWGPGLARVDRRATLLPGGHQLTDRDRPEETPLGPVGSHLYEPDDAVIRAGLVTAVANQVDGRLVDPKIAYVTADRRTPTPFARAFRILDEVPFHQRGLKAALKARGIGTLTVKKRGVDVVPEQLIAGLKLKGSETATIIMTRVADRGRAFLVEPLPHP